MYILWFYLLIGICFVTPPAITRELQNGVSCRGFSNRTQFQCQNGNGCVDMEHVCDGIQNCPDASDEGYCPHRRDEFWTKEPGLQRIRRQSTCGSIQWDCHDGNCISSENLCNEVADCADRSDENNPFCRGVASSKPGGCILPPYPMYGTYEVAKFPDARPGQALGSFVLTISCRRGFGVVDPNGGDGSNTQQLYCVNGEYQYQSVPKCVRFCKLKPDPSVRYMCHVPGIGFKVCPNYVAPGTNVNPVCNKPIYHSTDQTTSYIKCINGFWDNVAQCRAECGRVTPESTVLVIDGKEAKRGELPWHAGVYRKNDNYKQICSGSLITNNVVISAAHCFWTDHTKLQPASDFAAAIGKIYREWDSDSDANAQKSDVKEIRVPVLFQGAAANYQEDIAALILTTPFIYKLYIRPVCLYFDLEFERFQLKEGNFGKVAGWGLTATQGKPAETLKVLDMPFVPADTCIKALPPSFREYITGDKFCAGQLSEKALCKGDSGGGLVFPDRGLGIKRYYLRGIISAAPKDEEKLCNNYVYTAFTRISKHQDFINEVLAMSAEKKCSLYAFQCDDGSCVEQGSDCNGIRECADGSDETEALCKPGAKPEPVPSEPTEAVALERPEQTPLVISEQNIPVTTDDRLNPDQTSCILPEYPAHGYYNTNIPNSQPGQSVGSVLLTVSCQKGYRIKDQEGNSANSTLVECYNGRWTTRMPKCVRLCRLSPDPSVKFSCQGSSNCEEYVENGTAISVSCNSPDYYSDEVLPKMRCIDGFWDYVARCKTECGQETLLGLENNLKELIKDGTPAQHGEAPWHVGIHLKTPKPYRQICGGSIISHKIVLTAAHCFWDKNLLPASNYAVAAGKIFRAWNDNRDDAYNRDNKTQTLQKSDVKEIRVPPGFQGADDDIALLTLVTPFEFGLLIRPVCLYFDYELHRRQFETTGKVPGWGQTSIGGNFSPILRIVPVGDVVIAECLLPDKLKGKIRNKFCTGSRYGGVNLCDGFGGEGLVFPLSTGVGNKQRYFLRGIVSKFSGSDHVCDGPYNSYTNIMKYEHFIIRNLRESL